MTRSDVVAEPGNINRPSQQLHSEADCEQAARLLQELLEIESLSGK